MSPKNVLLRNCAIGLVVFLAAFVLLPTVVAQNYMYNELNPSGSSALSPFTAVDLNGDGRLDLVVPAGDAISVVLSQPDGTYAPIVYYDLDSSAWTVTTGDFNGDHILDLAVAGKGAFGSYPVSILLGTGNGAFGSPVDYAVGNYPVAIVAADFDADGKTDVAVLNNTDGTVSLLKGNGDGTFGTYPAVSVNSYPIAMVSADFNHDGLPDLAALSGDGKVTFLLNTRNGTFTSTVWTSADVTDGGDLAVGDFNGDGDPEVVFNNRFNQRLIIPKGYLTGAFDKYSIQLNFDPGTIGIGHTSVVTGDFNNDGKSDIAVGALDYFNYPISSIVPSTLRILLSNGDMTFQPPKSIELGINYSDPSRPLLARPMLVADFNNDNYLDLAVASETGRLMIKLGDGRGNFGGREDLAVLPDSDGVHGSAIADVNGDGKLDFVAAEHVAGNPGVTGLLTAAVGNGDGTFQPLITTELPTLGLGYLAAGDFTGDGKVDVATGMPAGNNGLSVFLGNGNGTFTATTGSPADIANLRPTQISYGDFNRDGKVDLALMTNSSSAGSPADFYVLLSNGDGTFRPQLVYHALDNGGKSFTSADLNHDGNLDIVVVDQNAGKLYLFLGKGDGTFSEPSILSVAGIMSYVQTGDFNGDGEVDLALQIFPYTGTVVLAGKGDGTFQPLASSTTNINELLLSGDFNGDGLADLVGWTQDTPTYRYLAEIATSNGDGTFASPVPFALPRGLFSITAGDLNGDGTTDLVETEQQPGFPKLVSKWLSTGTPVFSEAGLDFGVLNLGAAPSTKSVSLSNVGNAPLKISDIHAAGAFIQSNDCPAVLPIGSTCSVSVGFNPTTNGAAQGTLTFTDNARTKTQVLPLTAWVGGPDFALSARSNSATVTAGGTATYPLSLASGGGFSGTVQLTCSGAPAKSTCTLSKTSLTLSGTSSSASVTATVATTASYYAALSRPNLSPFGGFQLAMLCLVVVGPAGGAVISKRRRLLGALVFCVLALTLASCGGGGTTGGNGGGGGGRTLVPGTANGTYNLTISATSGGTTHSSTITLTVN